MLDNDFVVFNGHKTFGKGRYIVVNVYKYETDDGLFKFSIYVDRIQVLSELVKNWNTFNKIIVFIDPYIKKRYLKELMKMNNVYPVSYVVKNPKKHNSHFSSLIPFIPLFDFPKNVIKDYIIVDALLLYDKNINKLYILKNILDKKNIDIIVSGSSIYIKKKKNAQVNMSRLDFNLLRDRDTKYEYVTVRNMLLPHVTYIPEKRLSKELFNTFVNKDAYENNDKSFYGTRINTFDKNVDHIFLNKYIITKYKEYGIINKFETIDFIIYNQRYISQNPLSIYILHYLVYGEVLKYQKLKNSQDMIKRFTKLLSQLNVIQYRYVDNIPNNDMYGYTINVSLRLHDVMLYLKREKLLDKWNIQEQYITEYFDYLTKYVYYDLLKIHRTDNFEVSKIELFNSIPYKQHTMVIPFTLPKRFINSLRKE